MSNIEAVDNVMEVKAYAHTIKPEDIQPITNETNDNFIEGEASYIKRRLEILSPLIGNLHDRLSFHQIDSTSNLDGFNKLFEENKVDKDELGIYGKLTKLLGYSDEFKTEYEASTSESVEIVSFYKENIDKLKNIIVENNIDKLELMIKDFKISFNNDFNKLISNEDFKMEEYLDKRGTKDKLFDIVEDLKIETNIKQSKFVDLN